VSRPPDEFGRSAGDHASACHRWVPSSTRRRRDDATSGPHLSAARELGLAVLRPPEAIHVTVPRRSHPPATPGVVFHYSGLGPDEVARTSTDVLRTVVDCAVGLPFAEALPIADSALRQGLVGREDLLAAAGKRRGPVGPGCGAWPSTPTTTPRTPSSRRCAPQ
jgi:hypothetical protein